MTSLLEIAVIVAPGIYLLYFFLALFAIYARVRLPGPEPSSNTNLTEFMTNMPPSMREAVATLQSIDFVPIAATTNDQSDTRCQFVFLKAANDPCSAIVSVIERQPVVATVVGFRQTYRDGTSIGLSNSKLPTLFPYPSWKRSYRLPACADIGILYQSFQKLRRATERASERINLPMRDIRDDYDQEFARVFQFQVERGYQRKECVNNQSRITLRGAFLATWRFFWPVKPILNWLDEHKARSQITRGS